MDLILENIDLLLIAAIMLIAAVIFARRGQIELLRELIISIAGSVESEELYTRLPRVTKLLVSGKTVDKLVSENKPVQNAELL